MIGVTTGDGLRGVSTNHADILERLLTERFSCRAFQSRRVPRRVIERVLAIASARRRGATPNRGRC